MKTLEEIKNSIANTQGYIDWDELVDHYIQWDHLGLHKNIDFLTQEVAK